MNELRHCNGLPVAKIYQNTQFSSSDVQGGIVAFNLLRDDGNYVGFSEVSVLMIENIECLSLTLVFLFRFLMQLICLGST